MTARSPIDLGRRLGRRPIKSLSIRRLIPSMCGSCRGSFVGRDQFGEMTIRFCSKSPRSSHGAQFTCGIEFRTGCLLLTDLGETGKKPSQSLLYFLAKRLSPKRSLGDVPEAIWF